MTTPLSRDLTAAMPCRRCAQGSLVEGMPGGWCEGREECMPAADQPGAFWHLTDWHLSGYTHKPRKRPWRKERGIKGCEELGGAFGHPDCDPPRAAWEDALAMMRREMPAPDFLLAGGDWIGQTPPSRTSGHTVLSAAVLLNELMGTYFEDVPLLHTIGNHDTWPYFSLAPAAADWERAFSQKQGERWMDVMFPGEARTHFRQHGYYARRLNSRLWGISLNTNELAKTSGGAQLEWLQHVLQQLRTEKQSAMLLGHIPPGPSHFEFDSICAPGDRWPYCHSTPSPLK